MTCIETNTLRRDRYSFAKRLVEFLLREQRHTPLPEVTNDHLARDIGLEPHQLERLRFEWPSNGPKRPMI